MTPAEYGQQLAEMWAARWREIDDAVDEGVEPVTP